MNFATKTAQTRILVWLIWLMALMVYLQPANLAATEQSPVPLLGVVTQERGAGPLFPWQPRYRWKKQALQKYRAWRRAYRRAKRAAQLAGLSSVPAIVKETSPQQMLELALVENVQRADLGPLEEAAAYAQLMEAFGLTQGAVAERVGKSRAAVANTVRLLKLPEDIQAALAGEQISEGHARALLGLKEVRDQRRVLEAILARGLNVRQTEALVRQLLAGDEPSRPARRPPLSHRDKAIQEKFRSKLGTKVDLARGERGGKVVIHFYSDEELQAIFSAIAGEDSEL